MGIEARILRRGWVYCRWGRARSMGGSANLDEDAGRIHGDAGREDGFVNSADVDGVVDWLEMEREERGKEANERTLKVLEMLDAKERRSTRYRAHFSGVAWRSGSLSGGSSSYGMMSLVDAFPRVHFFPSCSLVTVEWQFSIHVTTMWHLGFGNLAETCSFSI
jgi:hypothetical protein